MYFALSMLSTVGVKGMHPISNLERIVSCLCMIGGMILFSIYMVLILTTIFSCFYYWSQISMKTYSNPRNNLPNNDIYNGWKYKVYDFRNYKNLNHLKSVSPLPYGRILIQMVPNHVWSILHDKIWILFFVTISDLRYKLIYKMA